MTGLPAILAQIDQEIAALQAAKDLLTGTPTKSNKPTKKMKRTLSPEARARIVAAQKKRWAAQKKKN